VASLAGTLLNRHLNKGFNKEQLSTARHVTTAKPVGVTRIISITLIFLKLFVGSAADTDSENPIAPTGKNFVVSSKIFEIISYKFKSSMKEHIPV